MANNYFQFKQFTIYQDRCALKVSTDSCIFGAWVSKKIAAAEHHIAGCLDIGAGTGLLMLMLAQRFPGIIHGVEIDAGSFEQAAENIATSQWYNRLHLFHDDVKLFSVPHQYDLIVTNPPFFEGDLKSASSKYNFAKHSDGLTLADLLEVAERNLSAKGIFAVLLPYHRTAYFEELAAGYGLFVTDKLSVRQSPEHPFFRTAVLMDRKNKGVQKKEQLIIRSEPEVYSVAFTELLRPFYLYL